MPINETLTAIYQDSRHGQHGSGRKALTTGRYTEVLHHFGPILARKYYYLSSDQIEIAGLTLPHVVVSLINVGLTKLMKPTTVVRTVRIDKFFLDQILRTVAIDYFRSQKDDRLAGKVNEELTSENPHVYCHEVDPGKSFFRNWWGACEWRDASRSGIEKFFGQSIDEGHPTQPYCDILKDQGPELSEGEIIRRYTLYLLKLVEKYLRFTLILDVFKAQFIDLQVVYESRLPRSQSADGDDDAPSDDWWQVSRDTSNLDPTVVREDLEGLLPDIRDRFIQCMRAAGLSYPEIEQASKRYAETATAKRQGFSRFGKSTAQLRFEAIDPKLNKLGYLSDQAKDLMVEILAPEFPGSLDLAGKKVRRKDLKN